LISKDIAQIAAMNERILVDYQNSERERGV
jgi:hypothetical protein